MRRRIALSESQYLAEVFCVDPKKIGMFWDAVEPLLAQGMEYSLVETTDDLLEALNNELALLWVVHTGAEMDAALVTKLKLDRDGNKFCTIEALAGRDLSNWIQLHSEITAYAKREGCTRMVHQLRPGFARVMMKKFGFKMINATIEKAI
jgi:hypothetical protein